MRTFLFLCAMCAPLDAAAQSVFDLIAAGPREQIGSDVVKCGEMTLEFAFYDENRRMSLIYTGDILDYEGNYRDRGDYTVLEVLDDGVWLQLDDESRVDAAGDPVRWLLRVTESGATCWQRNDMTLMECRSITIPCPGNIPIS